MIDPQLFLLSNEELEIRRSESEAAMIAARNDEAECRLHQMMRRHVKEGELKQRIADLETEIAALQSS